MEPELIRVFKERLAEIVGMAKIVFGAGVPHTPYFPRIVQQGGQSGARIQSLFGEVRQRLEASQPELLLIFDSDHFVNFFYNNLPTFCIGLADDAEGPYEMSRQMPSYKVPLDSRFGQALLTYGVNSGFDLAGAEELRLDHSILVPLHFLTPRMNIPVVPVFIKGLAQPLPRARRCYALGKMIRRFVESWPGNQRVAMIASGSFSLDVGGPQMGWIDQEWIKTIVQMVSAGKTTDLVRHATSRRMLAAGNTGGELLNWIALLGALDDELPTFIEPDLQPPEAPRDGHAYAVWEDKKL